MRCEFCRVCAFWASLFALILLPAGPVLLFRFVAFVGYETIIGLTYIE